jgi:NADH-quinone oxidoreductase subunit E
MVKDDLSAVLEDCSGERGDLIPVLQRAQGLIGFIRPDAVRAISRRLRISENEIYGVATFYAQFRFHPPGRRHVKICLGTACHVKGGEQVLATARERLGIDTGETTPDGATDLERVACLGCCALAPVVQVDDKIYGQMTVIKLQGILDERPSD